MRKIIDAVEAAVDDPHKLHLSYLDEEGRATNRIIRPLGLWFWGKVWTLLAWCELRDDFRGFRVDRIINPLVDGTRFKPERGKQLVDFYRKMEVEGWSRQDS